MNVAEAKRILQAPKFGDPDCIAAVKLLEREEVAEDLRRMLEGKQVTCWCCEGDGEIDCKAMCTYDCPTCDATGTLTLTPRVMKDLDLTQLQDIAKELQVAA